MNLRTLEMSQEKTSHVPCPGEEPQIETPSSGLFASGQPGAFTYQQIQHCRVGGPGNTLCCLEEIQVINSYMTCASTGIAAPTASLTGDGLLDHR